jgi:hypothetical protein
MRFDDDERNDAWDSARMRRMLSVPLFDAGGERHLIELRRWFSRFVLTIELLELIREL